jgi:hypothetical protein
MRSFQYDIIAPEAPTGTFLITARVAIPKDVPPNEVINFIRSNALKTDIHANWMRQNAPSHGMEVRGGPRPVLKDPKDRTSPILAYEQDFRICKGL